MIEYFSSKIKNKNELIISLHNHNDRGESVAQCELGLLAGAQRVEGCLFGNGERTGNLDVVTVALNMYTLGVDPNLDFSNLKKVAVDFSRLTGMEIHPRSPYAGNLVFTAFSGSHQDAIRKAMMARKSMPENALWDVPYLHIDPHDIGFEYEGIIRINNQSGKGGAVYVDGDDRITLGGKCETYQNMPNNIYLMDDDNISYAQMIAGSSVGIFTDWDATSDKPVKTSYNDISHFYSDKIGFEIAGEPGKIYYTEESEDTDTSVKDTYIVDGVSYELKNGNLTYNSDFIGN